MGFGLGGFIPRAIDSGALSEWSQSFDDEYWMKCALLESMEGVGRSNPNPAVGAVFVKDGQLLGKGATQAWGGMHAERVALQSVQNPKLLAGASCYVTLEPCAGQGRQPPCVPTLLNSGIRRCIIAAKDPHSKAAGLGLKLLRQSGISVELDVLGAECRAWLFPFLAYQQLQRPVVIGKWAQTLDGHLADDHGISQWISGRTSRAYTHWLRQKYSAILVGVGTALADAPRLTVRDSAPPFQKQPHKIVVDPKGRLFEARAEVFQNLREGLNKGAALFFHVVESRHWRPEPWMEEFGDLLVPVLIPTECPWPDVLRCLDHQHRLQYGHELQSIMVEGGPKILTSMLNADAIDAFHVFVRTGILGGEKHRVGRLDHTNGELPPQPRHLNSRHDFRLISSQQLGDDIVLESVHRRFPFW
jgi:diaminohydroxyphosphoribosylaminopyrimidine deaminase/5-amino-6-(5-phosphoribosylamino)uracil reductase